MSRARRLVISKLQPGNKLLANVIRSWVDVVQPSTDRTSGTWLTVATVTPMTYGNYGVITSRLVTFEGDYPNVTIRSGDKWYVESPA